MKWVLIYITLSGDFGKMADYGEYDSMEGCFDAREHLIEAAGRPIINYQAVCVAKASEEDLLLYQQELFDM
jgi:hypothetical protein